MIEIAMTPDQYTRARRALNAEAEIQTHTEEGANAGRFATRQVAMSYVYDGSATLQVAILAKYGMAKFASDATFKQRLEALLQRV